MRWYSISKVAELDSDAVNNLSGLYRGQSEVDPVLAASTIITMQNLVNMGLNGAWTTQTLGEAMGLLDRIGMDYQPPAQEEQQWDDPEEAFDVLMEQTPDASSGDMPAQTVVGPSQQPAQPVPQPNQPAKPRSRWRQRLRRRQRGR